ncbi:MAG: radical SAM protein, partial [Candidatus Omnitrophota bacterium]
MSSIIINRTKSLSPLTFKEIEAEIILEDGKVFLRKQDEKGNIYKRLLEKDYEFYKLMTSGQTKTQVPCVISALYISSRCNLNCSFCFEGKDGISEPSAEEIKALAKGCKSGFCAIFGREPTCREDLFEIIKILRKHTKRVCLLTNGIKLSDFEYTLKLKKSGLKYIFFSFNGLSDNVYRKLDGSPVLNLKLQALKNIEKNGIHTILSATIARGINDDQIKGLLEYAFRHRSFISELRIRTTVPTGRHLDIEPYCMSELLDLVTTSLEIEKEDVFKENIFLQEFFSTFKAFLPLAVRQFWSSRLCTLLFHVKQDGKLISSGQPINLERIKKSKLRIFWLAFYFMKI